MGFSSLLYLFFFLPAVLLLYYLVPGRLAKPIILFIASLVFYSFGQPLALGLLLLSCLFNYICGLDLHARLDAANGARTAGAVLSFVLAIFLNLLLPAAFVFLPKLLSLSANANAKATVPQVAVPLGLMFLMLRGISYHVDIWRGRGSAERNFFIFALYYTFFPSIALGPFDRFEKLRPTFYALMGRTGTEVSRKGRRRRKDEASRPSLSLFGSGVERFLFGFFKETLLAAPLYVLTLRIREVPHSENTTFLSWVLVITYALWLSLELSAYADMAIGTGRMLGFKLSENFDRPFLSLSIREFWWRWNITLVSWFRENIYQPIFRESGSWLRRIVGVVLAAGLFALWHGPAAAYLILAAYMVVLLLVGQSPVGRFFARFPDSLRWLFTNILLLVGVAILLSPSPANVLTDVFSLFGGAAGGIANATMLYYLRTNLLLLIVAIIAVSGLFLVIYRWVRKRLPVLALVLMLGLFGLALAAALGGGGIDIFARLALGA